MVVLYRSILKVGEDVVEKKDLHYIYIYIYICVYYV